MPAHKGHKKAGGRVKGTPNKKTQDLMQICEEEGVDPFRGMIIEFKRMEEPTHRFEALEKIAQYLYPKRKAVEMSGALDLRVQQEMEALSGLSEDELKKLLREELSK